jgi:hypothetical protein
MHRRLPTISPCSSSSPLDHQSKTGWINYLRISSKSLLWIEPGLSRMSWCGPEADIDQGIYQTKTCVGHIDFTQLPSISQGGRGVARNRTGHHPQFVGKMRISGVHRET